MKTLLRLVVLLALCGLWAPAPASAKDDKAAAPAEGDGGSALQRTLQQPMTTPQPEIKPDGPAPELAPDPEIVEALNEQAALRRAVSQLMLVTLEGSSMYTTPDRQLLERYTPGGVIISTVGRPSFAADYVASLRKLPYLERNGVPMLIGTNLFLLPRRDIVQRDYFAQMPSLLTIAAADDETYTRRYAEYLATNLNTMGFNMHLGPSLSLAASISDGRGTVDCLGSNPDFAARAAERIVGTFRDEGILPMALNFPGGSNNRSESDPPVLVTPRNVLQHADLLPYKTAIDAGIRMIHVGNTYVPTLDPEMAPACLSPVVMQDLLRQELGFTGVIVAGPVDAAHIRKQFSPSEAAILSLAAGADMLYWDAGATRVMQTVDDIVAAVVDGKLPQSLIEEKVARIAALKTDAKLMERPLPEKGKALTLEKKKRYPQEAYELERRSITLIYNRNQTLPLTPDKSAPIMVTGVLGSVELHGELASRMKKRTPLLIQPIVTARHAGEIHDFEVDRVTKRAAGLRTAICVFTSEERMGGQVEIVERLKAKGARVVVVLLGYPDGLPRFRNADAIILGYCSPNYVTATVQAIADVLVGNAPMRILPPVRDMETRVGHPESFNAFHVAQSPSGRLPVTIEPPYLAGLSVPYPITDTVKRVEWDFGDGKHAKGEVVNWTYDAAGRYPITLTLTDQNGEVTSGTFHALVTE
jgi:beta-N-acetylhexosaminidase